MKVFVVAIPLFNSEMTVKAYRLCARSGATAFGVQDDFRRTSEVLSTPGLDLIGKIGIEPFAADKPLLIDVNKFQLLTGVPTNLAIDPSKIVCVLPSAIPQSPEILERCDTLVQRGYTIALEGLPPEGINTPIVQYVSMLVLDYQNKKFSTWYEAIHNDSRRFRTVISGVPNMDTFGILFRVPKALFTGEFYRQPITAGISEISPIKINALQLMNQVNEEDFELEDIAKIIERDPSLSISLLRFINSGAVGLSRKVDSIKSAVAIMGQKEVRRWATVALSISLAEDRPGEITRLSLVRAKFAENLATAFELGVFQSSLFIAGLFSLLDVILQKPMEEAIQEVAVDERVRKALVAREGDLYSVLELIYAYEHADWNKTSILMIRAGTSIEAVSTAFVDALLWYNQLLTSIDDEPNVT